MKLANAIFWEVDMQADFVLPGGKLYVPGAEKISHNVGRLVQAAREGRVFLVSSADAHATGDPEFKLFPPHCVKGTPGAAIVPEGMAETHSVIPNRGAVPLQQIFDRQQVVLEKQTLDVFDNPNASEIVRLMGERFGPETEYVVFGVVTEYCVRCAAKGLLQRGCNVAVVADAIEALKLEEGRRTLDELTASGARLITTDQALAMARENGARGIV